MSHDWIVEVLDDLKSYSDRNRLPILARRFEEMRLVALSEIGAADQTAPGSASGAAWRDRRADHDEGPLFAPSRRVTQPDRELPRTFRSRRPD